jgi:uncharacterized repeat protein (TIGR02543 family)
MPSRRISAPDLLAPIQEISVQPYSSYNSDNVNMLTRIVTGDRNRDFIVSGLDVFGYNRVTNENLDTPIDIGGEFSNQLEFDTYWIGNNIEWDSGKALSTIPSPSKNTISVLSLKNELPLSDIGYYYKIQFSLEKTPKQLYVSLGSENYVYDHPQDGDYILYLQLNNENNCKRILTFNAILDHQDEYSDSFCYLDNISLTKVLNKGSDIEPLSKRFNATNDLSLNHNNISLHLLHPHDKCYITRGVAIKDETMINLLGFSKEDPISILEYGNINSWIHADPYNGSDFHGKTLIWQINNQTHETKYISADFNSDGELIGNNRLLDDQQDPLSFTRKIVGDLNKIEFIENEPVKAKIKWAYVCIYYSYFKNPEPNKAYVGLIREETLKNVRYGEDYLPLAKLRFVDSTTADAIIYYPDRIDWGYIDATRITYDHLNQLKHWTNKPLNVSLALDLLASRIYNFKGMLYFQTHQNFLNWIGAKTETDGKYLLSDGGFGIIGTGHGPIDYLQNINGADTENSYDLCAYILETNSFWRSQILSDGNEPIKLNYNLRILWSEIQQKRFEVNWTNLNNGDWPNSIPANWSYWNGSEWNDSPSLISWNNAKSKWPNEYYAEKPTGSGGYTKINPFNPEGLGMVPGPDSELDDIKYNRFLRSDGTWQSIGRGVLVFENYHEFALWYKNKSYEWTSDKQIKFTITYNGNECDEGSEIPVEQTKYLDEDIYLAYKGSLIKVGYDFDGWNTRSDGTGLNFNENDLFTINADTVLYAKWRPSFWIIQYNGNGNDQGIPPDSVEQPKGGNTIISSHGNLSRNYHSFIGWNTESDGSGTSYTPGQEVQFDSDITLYAMWSLITYTIQYSDQSAESGSAPDPQVKYHNTPITLHGNSGQLYRQNYDLVGWSTNSGGVGGYMFGLGAEYHLNMSATLYPTWRYNPPAAPKITLRVVLIDESDPYRAEGRCITDSNLWRCTYESTRLNETNKIRIYHLSKKSNRTKWDSIWNARAVNSLAGHIVQVVRPLVSERETFFTSTIYDEISNSFGWDNINKIIFLLDTSGSSSSLTKSDECTNFISSLNSDGRSVLSYNLTDEKWLQWLWTY